MSQPSNQSPHQNTSLKQDRQKSESLKPSISPGSTIEKLLNQVFALAIILGLVLLLFFGCSTFFWVNIDQLLAQATSQAGMPQEQVEIYESVQVQLDELPEDGRTAVTVGLILFGILPAFFYLSLAGYVKRFSTPSIIILMVIAVMQTFVTASILASSILTSTQSPCQLMSNVLVFGTACGVTGTLAWKLFQIRQYQVQHLLQLQRGLNRELRQQQVTQIARMAQDQKLAQQRQVDDIGHKPTIEPWDEF